MPRRGRAPRTTPNAPRRDDRENDGRRDSRREATEKRGGGGGGQGSEPWSAHVDSIGQVDNQHPWPRTGTAAGSGDREGQWPWSVPGVSVVGELGGRRTGRGVNPTGPGAVRPSTVQPSLRQRYLAEKCLLVEPALGPDRPFCGPSVLLISQGPARTESAATTDRGSSVGFGMVVVVEPTAQQRRIW